MISLIFLSAFPAALIIAALNDLYEFKIPNWISILLIVAYFAAGIAIRAPAGAMIEGTVIAALALVIGFALFAGKIIGGGDAKLFAASALWIGLPGLAPFLLNMALSGAAFAIALIVFRRFPALPIYSQMPWLLRLHQSHKSIPYAVAICAGGLMSFQHTLYFKIAFEA
ncbi:MAG: prepilin peptidase [Pseudomonadota bacterium]